MCKHVPQHDCAICRASIKAEFDGMMESVPDIRSPKCDCCGKRRAIVRVVHACGSEHNGLSCLECWTLYTVRIELMQSEPGAAPYCRHCGEPATLNEHVRAIRIARFKKSA